MDITAPPKRILIIDDEPVILKMLNHHLRSCNFEALTTSLWTEAVDIITHDPPDLLLLDLHMPTIQGDALLEFIREQGCGFPVIVISAYLTEQKMEKLQELGVSQFLKKPFHLQDLNAAIRSVLEPVSNVQPSPIPETPPSQTELNGAPGAPGIVSTPDGPRNQAHRKDAHRHRRKRHSRLRNHYIALVWICLAGSFLLVLMRWAIGLLSTYL